MFAVLLGNVKQFYPNYRSNFASEAVLEIDAGKMEDETVSCSDSPAPSLLLIDLAGTIRPYSL